MIASLATMVAFGAGVFIANGDKLLPDQRLFLNTSGCPSNISTTESPITLTDWHPINWKDNDDSVVIQILSISYIWYTAMGFLITVVLGLIFSFLTSFLVERESKLDYDLFSPPMYKFWRAIFRENIDSIVEPEDDDEPIVFTTTSKSSSVS